MVSTHVLLAFSASAFALIVVPGPSVLFVVSRGVALGRRAALLTVLGNAGGALTQVALLAAGLGPLVQRSIVLYTVVKLVGAAYLVLLGVQAIRHRRRLHLDEAATGVVPVRSPRRLLVDGYVVGAANPKVFVFFAAILTPFVDPAGGPVPLQMAILGLVFVVIALISDGAWGLVAGTARGWLARSPRRLSNLTGGGGLVMVGLGVRLAVSGRTD